MLHVLAEPRGDDLARHQKLGSGDTVSPAFAADLKVAVDDLFG